MDKNNLESSQSYHARCKFGHGRTEPDDPKVRGFVCQLCMIEPVEDEDSYCPSCQADQAEYECEDR